MTNAEKYLEIKKIIEEYKNTDWGEADAEETLDSIIDVIEK